MADIGEFVSINDQFTDICSAVFCWRIGEKLKTKFLAKMKKKINEEKIRSKIKIVEVLIDDIKFPPEYRNPRMHIM